MLSANILYSTSARAVIKYSDLSTSTIESTATYGLAVCAAPKMSSTNEKFTLVRLLNV